MFRSPRTNPCRSACPAPALDCPAGSPVREAGDLSRLRGRWVTDAAGRLVMIWEVAGAAPAGTGVPHQRFQPGEA